MIKDNFIKTIYQEVIKNNKLISPNSYIILPSKRICNHFADYMRELSISKFTLLPSILTMEEFIKTTSDISISDNITILATYYKFFREKRHISFEEFIPLGLNIIDDLDIMDKNLLESESIDLFSFLSREKSIDRWADNHLGKTDIEKSISQKNPEKIF